MPQYRHAHIPGGSYFFTVVTERRQPVLTDEPVRQALREAIKAVRETRPFRIDGWVLLPDPLHAVWALPADDDDYPTSWPLIKARVTRDLGEAYLNPVVMTARRSAKQEGSLWQHRYWEHWLRDEADVRHHLDYLCISTRSSTVWWRRRRTGHGRRSTGMGRPGCTRPIGAWRRAGRPDPPLGGVNEALKVRGPGCAKQTAGRNDPPYIASSLKTTPSTACDGSCRSAGRCARRRPCR